MNTRRCLYGFAFACGALGTIVCCGCSTDNQEELDALKQKVAEQQKATAASRESVRFESSNVTSRDGADHGQGAVQGGGRQSPSATFDPSSIQFPDPPPKLEFNPPELPKFDPPPQPPVVPFVPRIR